MGQRAYCDQDHPASDADADRWCEDYHRPQVPAPSSGDALTWTTNQVTGVTSATSVLGTFATITPKKDRFGPYLDVVYFQSDLAHLVDQIYSADGLEDAKDTIEYNYLNGWRR